MAAVDHDCGPAASSLGPLLTPSPAAATIHTLSFNADYRVLNPVAYPVQCLIFLRIIV